MAPPRRDTQSLAGLGEIPKGFEGFLIDDRGAYRHLYERILTAPPGHLPAGAGLPRLRAVARLEAEIHERI